MAYLRHPVPITLMEDIRHTNTYFAKVFDGHPKDLPLAMQEEWQEKVPKIQKAIQKAVDTPSKPFESITLMFDAGGCFLLVTYSKPVTGATPNTTVKTLLSAVLPEALLDTILKDLHPLDEVDKERITSMRTLKDCVPPAPKPAKEASAATLQMLQNTEISLADKIAAYTTDVASDSEEDALPSTTVLATRADESTHCLLPTSSAQNAITTDLTEKVSTARKNLEADQSEQRLLALWGRITLRMIDKAEAPDRNKYLYNKTGQTKCWTTWNALRIQHHRQAEESLGDDTLGLAVQVADLKANTDRLEFFKEAVTETAAYVLASAGLVQLKYRRCNQVPRRELLITKRLNKTPTLIELFRTVATMIDDAQLPPLRNDRQRSAFKHFCFDLLKKLNPTVDTKTLTAQERLAIGVALCNDKPICPCGKPGKIAFPKASWDWLDTDQENADLTECYNAFCSDVCLKRHRPKYCPKCFKDDQLEDIFLEIFPRFPECYQNPTVLDNHRPILRCNRCRVNAKYAGHPDDPAFYFRPPYR